MVRRSKEEQERILARVLGRSEDERVVKARFSPDAINDTTLESRVMKAVFDDDMEWVNSRTSMGATRARKFDLTEHQLTHAELTRGLGAIMPRLRVYDGVVIDPTTDSTVTIHVPKNEFAGAQQLAKDMLKAEEIGRGGR